MSDFETKSSNMMEIIIKLTEICNINCTYCYMFNMGNDDFTMRPQRMREGTIDDIISFILNGIVELDVKELAVVLHGGEPLMMRKRDFELLCQKLRLALDGVIKLVIGIQTNAILIDEEWISIFERQKICASVSLDGPPQVHDRNRVDKRGRGTYAKTLVGLERLREAHQQGRIAPTGIICVIDPLSDAKQVFRHLVHDLGLRHVSFNLPMETVDTMTAENAQRYATYVKDLFEIWAEDDDPSMKLRLFDHMFKYLIGDVGLIDHLSELYSRQVMAVIASDGTLSDHDDYKIINFAQRGGNVATTTLSEYANSPLREYLSHLNQALPDDCRQCEWANMCRAGASEGLTISRYSEQNGFNNRSSFCQTFQAMYEAGATYLANNGVPVAAMQAALSREDKSHVGKLRPPPKALFSTAADLLETRV